MYYSPKMKAAAFLLAVICTSLLIIAFGPDKQAEPHSLTETEAWIKGLVDDPVTQMAEATNADAGHELENRVDASLPDGILGTMQWIAFMHPRTVLYNHGDYKSWRYEDEDHHIVILLAMVDSEDAKGFTARYIYLDGEIVSEMLSDDVEGVITESVNWQEIEKIAPRLTQLYSECNPA